MIPQTEWAEREHNSVRKEAKREGYSRSKPDEFASNCSENEKQKN